MKNLEFIQELKKQGKIENRYRMFDCISAGKYEMSIQGSEAHYCSPRETCNPEYYERMEIAIFKDGKWIHNAKSSVIRNFPRYDELMRSADGKFTSNQVFGWLSVDIINDLYIYLSNH